MSSRKLRKLAICKEVAEDRISELHPDLKHLILKDFPIAEIARTTVLSTQWRHILRNHPKLIFDQNAYKYWLKNQPLNTSHVDKFLKTIDRILSTHTGLVDEFALFIPFVDSCRNSSSHVHQVMCVVPTTITKLSVRSEDIGSYPVVPITQFVELTRLELYRCLLNYHPTMTLLKLTQLHLDSVSFPHNFLQSLSRIAPKLERLSLRRCCCWSSCPDTATIDAPRLKEFVMDYCRLRHCSFSETAILSSVTLRLHHKWNNPDGFHRVLPKLTMLEILDFDTIMVLSPCLKPIEFSDCKPWALKKLTLRGIRLNQPSYYLYIVHRPISSFMRHLILLLERAKNIQELRIEDSTRDNELYPVNLDKFIFKDVTLDRLETLSFVFVTESHLDLQLFRSILPCLPAFVNLNIGYSRRLDSTEQERVVECVSEFCRALPSVNVTYFHI